LIQPAHLYVWERERITEREREGRREREKKREREIRKAREREGKRERRKEREREGKRERGPSIFSNETRHLCSTNAMWDLHITSHLSTTNPKSRLSITNATSPLYIASCKLHQLKEWSKFHEFVSHLRTTHTSLFSSFFFFCLLLWILSRSRTR